MVAGCSGVLQIARNLENSQQTYTGGLQETDVSQMSITRQFYRKNYIIIFTKITKRTSTILFNLIVWTSSSRWSPSSWIQIWIFKSLMLFLFTEPFKWKWSSSVMITTAFGSSSNSQRILVVEGSSSYSADESWTYGYCLSHSDEPFFHNVSRWSESSIDRRIVFWHRIVSFRPK